MPVDSIVWSYDNDSVWRNHCLGWHKEFCFIPRRCYYSKKVLWLKNVYKGTAMWTGPGEPVFESRWCDTKEFLLQQIKGKV
jgi:hypothetical protein